MTDTWFAWYPVRCGALGTGKWAWFEKVWRNRCAGVTIYQQAERPPVMAEFVSDNFAKIYIGGRLFFLMDGDTLNLQGETRTMKLTVEIKKKEPA